MMIPVYCSCSNSQNFSIILYQSIINISRLKIAFSVECESHVTFEGAADPTATHCFPQP